VLLWRGDQRHSKTFVPTIQYQWVGKLPILVFFLIEEAENDRELGGENLQIFS
jgi:hypothetical protein